MVSNEPAMPPGAASPAMQTGLEANAIGLLGATMQAITHIAPAIAGFFFTAAIVGFTGVTAPLAYLVGFLIVLMLGSTLAQLAKHLPSAGGYYTYVSRAIHPRAGFLTSWMYILYSPLVGGPLLGFFGFIINGELKTAFNVDLPWLWAACILVGAPFIAFLQWEGIKLSTRFMLVAGGLEMAIVFLLAIFGFLNAGPSGISLEVFDPGKISVAGFEGFFLAVVFSVQGLTGWEASAPLAEETRDPKRNVPRSVMLSITIIGIFLIIVFWGVITGFNNDPSAITGSTDLPALALAHKVWGSAWIIILFAFLNSVVGASLACANVATRMWYSMARSGSFPRALAVVHPVHKTPTNAILAQMIVSIASGIIGGIIYGPDVSFFFLVGLVLVLAVTVVYIMANIAVFRFYWTEHRDEFNVILHVVFPVVSSAVLIYAVYKSFPQPDPYWQAIFLDGGWLLIGVVLLVVLYLRGDEDWLVKAGEAVSEA